MKLYEILVPTNRNDGRPISARFHRIWDAKVMEISGGITILSPAKGKWSSTDNELFDERMIPVRIACNEIDIDKIIDFTMDYYEQLAVMAYVVSDEVIIKEREKPLGRTACPTSEDLSKLRRSA
jgi:hypothetical protein